MNGDATIQPGSRAAGQPGSRLRWLEVGARTIAITLGVMFLWTASAKALDPTDFMSFVGAFVPRGTISFVLWGTIVIEFFLGSALLFRQWRSISLCVTIGLLALFSLFLASAAVLGVDQSCGCGLGDVSPTAAILRNLVIAILAGGALLVHWHGSPLEGDRSCVYRTDNVRWHLLGGNLGGLHRVRGLRGFKPRVHCRDSLEQRGHPEVMRGILFRLLDSRVLVQDHGSLLRVDQLRSGDCGWEVLCFSRDL